MNKLIILTLITLVWSVTSLAEFAPKTIRTFPYFDKHFKTIALTIDDGPDAIVTPRVLDLLKQYNIKATFFLVGKNIEENTSIVKRMVAEGHVIANHTFTHRQFLSKTNPDGSFKCYIKADGTRECKGVKPDGSLICDPIDLVMNEIKETDDLLQKYVSPSQKRLYYRPPGGGWCRDDVPYSATLNKVPSLSKYAGPVYWQMGGSITFNSTGKMIDAGDEECWEGNKYSVDQCLAGYLEAISRKEAEGKGGMLLNHDVHIQSFELLKELIPQLVDRGYTFITLDQDTDFNDPQYGM